VDIYIGCGVIPSNSPSYISYPSRQYPSSASLSGVKGSTLERESRQAEHDDPARRCSHVPRSCLNVLHE
jgi:hypothetical protein